VTATATLFLMVTAIDLPLSAGRDKHDRHHFAAGGDEARR